MQPVALSSLPVLTDLSLSRFLYLSLFLALFMINSPKLTQKLAPALRVVMSGAAPIGQHDVERFIQK